MVPGTETRPCIHAQWFLCSSLACETISLPLCPPPPSVSTVWPAPPAQGRGQSRACWEEGVGGLAGIVPPSLAAWPNCGGGWRLLWLRLMRPGLWPGYRVLQNRRPAGTSCPLCLPPPPALRTRLIGTPNCPYEYFRGEQEWELRVGVWFQGP